MRRVTPHPKQLKARHPNLFKEKGSSVDGHVIPHDPEREKDGGAFVPQRESAPLTQTQPSWSPPDYTHATQNNTAVKPTPSEECSYSLTSNIERVN